MVTPSTVPPFISMFVTVGADAAPIVTPSIVPPLISEVATLPKLVTVGADDPPIVTPSIVPASTSTELLVLNAIERVIHAEPFQNFQSEFVVSLQIVPVCLLAGADVPLWTVETAVSTSGKDALIVDFISLIWSSPLLTTSVPVGFVATKSSIYVPLSKPII